ncbi:MAG: hypothetical protein Ct9H90mP24_7180 [Methanobacteriota archaeon]|nr:MAG: hypothetical protein Ct9H90mP24_7180 [Euryarchaeota archaeon]
MAQDPRLRAHENRSFGENIVFTTVTGVYMIDSDANEIWRGMLPRWPDISSLFAFDQIVGIVEFPGGLSIWSRAGGVSVIDPSNGLEIFSRTIQFGDKISGVSYSEEGVGLLCCMRDP